MRQLSIKAGPKAYDILVERGLRKEDVHIIAAAAGGPRWLILYELDKFLYGEWLANKKERLDLIGASAGAWQMACAAQKNPVQALDKLYHYYVNQRYPERPSTQEVSDKSRIITEQLLGENGVQEILESQNRKLHVLTNVAKFNFKDKNLKFNLLKIALANLFSRKNLNRFIERNVFSTSTIPLIDEEMDIINTTRVALNTQNLPEALLASGAIPLVIEPIRNIKGKNEVHFDGGLVDYHLNIPYNIPSDGLVLHPHFMNRIIPGWLDKYLPFRKMNSAFHDNTVLIYPSDDFLQTLPRKKIPERQDFEFYFKRDDERIEYWYDITERSKVLVEEFKELLSLDSLEGHVLRMEN